MQNGPKNRNLSGEAMDNDISGKQRAMSGSAIEDLVVTLKTDKDWQMRSAAARELGKREMLSDNTISALSVALKDEELWVRWEAALAFLLVLTNNTQKLTTDAISALLFATKDADSDIKRVVIIVLGYQIGYHADIPQALYTQVILALLFAKKDEVEDVRRAASAALEMVFPEMQPALSIAIKDENEDVRSYAARALRALGVNS